MAKIILCNKPIGEKYSVEAGVADNKYHFDHHGAFSNYPSPCNNPAVSMQREDRLDFNVVIRITHFDADTYLGVLRLLGLDLPDVNTADIERIDCNGTKGIRSNNRAMVYMEGLDVYRGKLDFPRVSDEPQDVTEYLDFIYGQPIENIMQAGKLSIASQKQALKDCFVARESDVALYKVGKGQNFNPSSPYDKGIKVVLVYWKKLKAISLYCDPDSKYEFGNREVGDIYFAGHAKACGSPRGVQFKYTDAKKVFKAVVKEVKELN